MSRIRYRKTVYENRWLRVTARTVDTPGLSSDEPYYALEQHDYVHVLALTDEDDVLLVRQYRPAVEAMTTEMPSGHIEAGETPAECARRELAEETGYTTPSVELLSRIRPDTGRLSNSMWCFLARGARPLHGSNWVPETGLEVVRLPLNEYLAQIEDGASLNCMDLATLMIALGRGLIDLPHVGRAADTLPV